MSPKNARHVVSKWRDADNKIETTIILAPFDNFGSILAPAYSSRIPLSSTMDAPSQTALALVLPVQIQPLAGLIAEFVGVNLRCEVCDEKSGLPTLLPQLRNLVAAAEPRRSRN